MPISLVRSALSLMDASAAASAFLATHLEPAKNVSITKISSNTVTAIRCHFGMAAISSQTSTSMDAIIAAPINHQIALDESPTTSTDCTAKPMPMKIGTKNNKTTAMAFLEAGFNSGAPKCFAIVVVAFLMRWGTSIIHTAKASTPNSTTTQRGPTVRPLHTPPLRQVNTSGLSPDRAGKHQPCLTQISIRISPYRNAYSCVLPCYNSPLGGLQDK